MEVGRSQYSGRLKWDVPMKIDLLSKGNDKPGSPDCVLELACFVKPPIMSFENVKIGCAKIQNLRILNPGVETERIELEKFPLKETGFAVNGLAEGETLRISLEPQQELVVPITWQPKVAGNSRHLVVFKWIGGQKLQVVILASAIDPDAGKKKKVKRRPAGKTLQPSSRTNIFQQNTGYDKLTKDKPPKPATPEHGNTKNLVEILPDTPSRRQTFTVVQSNLQNKMAPKCDNYNDEKENIAVNEDIFGNNKATFRIEREGIDKVEGTVRKNPFLEVKEVEISEKDDEFTSQRDNFTDASIFDTNTFHESEIRLSSSPIKLFGRGETTAMLKPSSDLNPGQVVMNGEVKHQFIPYPSFNNTDTFLHMEMAMESKPKQGYDDSLSFGSAASSLFTLTREERFSPHLETVCESSDVGAGTPKSDMTTTLTNENCAETFVDNNGSQYVPCFEEGVSADETSDTLRASDANDMPQKEVSLISDQLGSVEAVSFEQDAVITLVNLSRSVICDSERQSVGLPPNSTLFKGSNVEKDEIERAPNEKNEEQNIVETKDVDQLCVETSRFMANPIVASQELSIVPTSKDTGKSRPNKKTSIARKFLPSGASNSNFDSKELAKKSSRKSTSRFVESRYLSSQNKQKSDKNDNKKEAKQEIKTGSNVVDAKFKSLTAPKKRKSDEDSSKDMAKPSLAMKKLKLIKPKSKMPRHPMPYAARNMFYDERWIEKQERGFKNWLNFVLTPPEDDVGNEEEPRKGNLLLESDSSQPVAPTKEVLSFRMYAARRRMARLRRAACIHYQSDQLASVICKLEREIEHGRLALRSDRQVDADLGVRKHIADMLLSFNPLWLRIGLEVVYGEIIPMHSNNDVNSLSRFIQRRLLGNPDIAAEYSHPSVPGLFRQGYVETLAKFTLKKLLLVIIFVDSAKNSRLLSHDPCLFRIDSEFKATRDTLLCFSRHYLHREGDLVKHLTYLGYTVSHSQTPLHEYDFGVTNLAVDLRDGLRLVRVVELLTKNWKLSSRLRVPAVSRLQKVHNVGIALLGLKEHEFVQNGLNIDPKYIVDGHREKTLLLLWQIIFHFQVDLLLDEDKLKDEIKHLEKSKQLKLESEDMQHHECAPSNRRESLDSGVYFKSHKLSLLLKWCRLVCALHGVKVENFTVSFSDGRALCYLLHHYHPALLPTQSIKNDTSITCGLSLDADQDVDDQLIYENWTQCFSPSTGVNRKLEKLLKNEKQNFTVFSDKVKEIGGGPVMISASDMSNTIPDEKVVIAFLSFLCSRLLDIREEIRAARCIQIAWRQHHLRKQKRKYKALSAAVVKLQAYARGYILRQKMKKKEVACIKFQACWRGYATRKQIRKDAAEKHVMHQEVAAAKIQIAVRGYLQRRSLLHQKQSAIVLQTAIRKYLLKKRLALRSASATRIQQRYREWKLAVYTRKQFLEKRYAAITLQRVFRANRQIMKKKSESATIIQSFWRMHKCRQDFSLKKEAAVLIQNSFRSHSTRQKFLQTKHAVAILQSRWRALQNGKAIRRAYRKKRDSVILIQQVYREFAARRAKKTQKAAVCIQAATRMVLQRNRYNTLRKTVVSVQAMLRGKIVRKRHALLIKATVMIQKRFRAVKRGKSVRHDFERLRTSCLLLQARYRGLKCRSKYTSLRVTTVKIQACYRGKKCRDEYLKLQASTLLLQQRFRAWKLGKAARNELKEKRDSCVVIQAWYRGSRQQQRYLSLKIQANKMQAIFRGNKARRSYLALRNAVVNMQRRYRATVVSDEMRRSYLEQKNACIVIQSWYRCRKMHQKYTELKQAAISIQSNVRRFIAFKRHQELKSSTLVIQRRYRALKIGQATQIHYLVTKAATLTLQSIYRGYRVRKELNRCHQAAVKIQAIARMHLTRQKYIKLKSVTICMQTRYRASRLARDVLNNYRAFRHSTIILQAAYRGHQARKELNRCHQAAVKIQAVARMHSTRQKYMELKSVVICMQTRYTAWRLAREVSNNYRALKQSTIVLQAVYRGHQVRKELNRCHQAAVKIQAIARMHSTRQKYIELKLVVIRMQTRYRASRLAREVSKNYRALKQSTIVLQAVYRGHQARKELANMSGAATKIQAIYRTYAARNRFQRMRKAAILIQSSFRRHQRLMEYQKMKSSTVKIQKIFRGYKKTKQAVDEYQKAKRCATTIQAFYRCYAQRREFVRVREAAVRLQRFWRQHLQKKVQELAAVVLQTRWKAYQQAKVVRAAYVNQKQACILIQSVYRRHAAVQKYALIKASILVIQRRFVAYKAMVGQMRNYQALRKSVILIQATYKMYCVRKAYVAKKFAAITVQRMLRSHLAKKKQQKKLDAAIVIQRHWTAYAAMLKCRTEYQRKRQAVVVLQSSFRRLSTRRRFIRMKKAAVVMQSWYRMIVARRKFIKKQNAAIFIQRHFRAYVLGTVVAANYHVMRGALITLQAGVRGFCARKQYNLQRRLIINLQASIKMFVYRNRYQELRAVTILIQRRVRSNVMATLARKEFLLKKRACVRIQRGYRRHRDVKMAAISIQAVFRMRRERRAFASKKAACVKIQTVFRRCQQRKAAATVIQSLWRMHRARKEFITKKKACIKVQASVRRFLAEQQYLLQQGAALVIQRRFRAFLLGSLERLRYLNARYACVQIQACFRMLTCRRRYLLLRASTITIQQRLRAQIAMKTERDVLAKTKSAAVKVQSAYRGYKARQLVASLRQQNMIKEYIKLVERQKVLLRRISAATIIQKNHRAMRDRQRFLDMKNAAFAIQSSYKMHKLMIATRYEFLQQKRSVVTIQRAYRVYKAKERLQNLKDERDLRHNSAIVLQRNFKRFISQKDFLVKKLAIKKIQIVYRRYLLARQLRNEFIAKRHSAVKLQCAFRVYKSCQVVKMLREEKCRQTDACVKIQKSFKGFLVRKRFLSLRNAAVAIQNVFRAAQLGKKIRAEFLSKREASIVIQTTYRGYRTRKLLEELRLQRERYQAIVVRMQRQFRALAATRKQRALFVNVRKAAIVIQRSYRGYRKKEALARHEAAIVIQRGYRAYRERVMAKFITAAVKIQSCFRRYTHVKNYKRMKLAAMIIQTKIREVLRRRKDARQEQAAVVVQKWFRSVSLMRIERKKFIQTKKACLIIQSVWRGYKVRSKICNRKVIKARERIESANSEATEEKKLCNRTTSALAYLLHCRSQTTIFEALKNLEVATRLSYHCCERLAEDNALVVIFEIVKNCNRGLPSIELIQIAISVVINLARCPTTYKYIYEEEDSLELFVDLMNKYREKKTPIFARSATLLSLLCQDAAIAKEIRSNKGIMKRLQSFHYLTGRKANMESKRNGTKLKATPSMSKDKKDHLYIFDQFASICRLMERLDNVNVAI